MVLVFSESHSTIITINLGIKKPHMPLLLPPKPPLQPWATTSLRSVSIDLLLLGFSFPPMESYNVALYDRLFSLNAMFSRFIHVMTCIILDYYIRPSNIPSCIYTTFYVSVHQSMGYFHFLSACTFNFLAIVPSVIINNSLPRRIHHHEPRS